MFLQAPYGKHNRPGWGPTISPFLFHYFHKTCIYPLCLHNKHNNKSKTNYGGFPVSMAMMAFVFNLLNAYLQARWVSQYKDYEGEWWFWLRFFVGLVVFLGGMGVNIWSDRVLVAQPIQVMDFWFGFFFFFFFFFFIFYFLFFIFYFFILYRFSFFHLNLEIYFKKKRSQNDIVLAQLTTATNWILTESCIDKNWKLED